jgi:PIN domain nuclease of toxin-antitoxin system
MGKRVEEPVSAYLDTHVAAWLFAGATEKLSAAARIEIDAAELRISPMVLLELEYLYERKRIRLGARSVHSYLNSRFGVSLCDIPFPAVAMEAASIGWVSDPFDRIIVAQAQANGESKLVTADTLIRRHYRRAVW